MAIRSVTSSNNHENSWWFDQNKRSTQPITPLNYDSPYGWPKDHYTSPLSQDSGIPFQYAGQSKQAWASKAETKVDIYKLKYLFDDAIGRGFDFFYDFMLNIIPKRPETAARFLSLLIALDPVGTISQGQSIILRERLFKILAGLNQPEAHARNARAICNFGLISNGNDNYCLTAGDLYDELGQTNLADEAWDNNIDAEESLRKIGSQP